MGAYFCINIAADFNEQVLIKRRTKETYNKGKTLRIAATATFVTSPMLYAWVRFIEKVIPGKTLMCVCRKVLADTFCFAPVVITSFYVSTNILELKSDLMAEWKQKFLTTWTTGMCYWPFVQGINFAFIPVQYKTCVYTPVASFIWMNYLCFMKEQKVVGVDEDEDSSIAQALPDPANHKDSLQISDIFRSIQAGLNDSVETDQDLSGLPLVQYCQFTEDKVLTDSNSETEYGFSEYKFWMQPSTELLTHSLILSPH